MSIASHPIDQEVEEERRMDDVDTIDAAEHQPATILQCHSDPRNLMPAIGRKAVKQQHETYAAAGSSGIARRQSVASIFSTAG